MMWILVCFLLVCFFVLLVESSSVLIKCCPHGYAFNNDLRCVVPASSDSVNVFEKTAFGNQTEPTHTCYRSDESAIDLHDDDDELKWGQNITKVEKCIDVDPRNGTVYTWPCPVDWREKLGRCDSIFKPILLWGASIVIFANLIYLFPFLIVVVLFFVIADLRNRAYDKAVLSYNASQLVIALTLIGIGYCVLCHEPIRPTWVLVILGLTLQFLTITSVFWLNVICFDMTLVITRFRWIPGSDVTGAEDKRKFRMYAAYAWGGAVIITAITCFIELCPWIPISSPFKPNFKRFNDGANYAVIAYTAVVPLITLVLNNVLFAYTTYKVIKIRKSTAVVNENNKKAEKKYFVFLRLYLVMDAPWIIGILAAVYPDLWILKFCRMLQPILMLLAILPKKTFDRVIKCFKTPVTKTVPENKNNGGETRC